MTTQKGITLIGMSGAGKTTIGPILSKRLSWPIYDIDNMIIKKEGKLIGQIVKEGGQERLLDLETDCVAQQDLHRHILVTPGSIVYDVDCHQKLKDETIIVWLDASLKTLMARFGQDPKKQAAVVGADGGFELLNNKRRPLYVALADLTIRCEDKTPSTIAQEIISRLNKGLILRTLPSAIMMPMTQEFNEFTKQVADEIIAMSQLLASKMESWADVFVRHPDSQGVNASAGFISNPTEVNRLEIGIDVRAPSDTDLAVIRVKAIETVIDANGNERFHGISLSFGVNYSAARQLVEKAGSITRKDITLLMHVEATHLADILICDETGKDKTSEELLGKRYNLESSELSNLSKDTADELTKALSTVLTRLKQTVASEAKS